MGGIVGEWVESVSVACEDDSQEHGEWAVGKGTLGKGRLSGGPWDVKFSSVN